MPISRSKEGGCAAGLVCVAIKRSDGITILGDLLATYVPYFMCSMPHMGKGANRPHRRPCLLRTRGCASWQRNRVLQSAESKQAVVQQEPLESMSEEATEMRFAVSGTMGEVVGGERGRGLC